MKIETINTVLGPALAYGISPIWVTQIDEDLVIEVKWEKEEKTKKPIYLTLSQLGLSLESDPKVIITRLLKEVLVPGCWV